MLTVFVPLQVAVLVLLVSFVAIGPGLAALTLGIALGIIVVVLLALRGRRQVRRVAPEDRLFGAVATAWATEMSGGRFQASTHPQDRSRDRPIDGICWVDQAGVHWRPGKARAGVHPFDARPDEIDVARVAFLGGRNVGLQLLLRDGGSAALKVNGNGKLRLALEAIDVTVDAS